MVSSIIEENGIVLKVVLILSDCVLRSGPSIIGRWYSGDRNDFDVIVISSLYLLLLMKLEDGWFPKFQGYRSLEDRRD